MTSLSSNNLVSTWKRWLFLVLLPVLTACNGQVPPPVDRQVAGRSANPGSIGAPVPALDTSILIIFQDSHDNYWFGSDGNGVYRYNPSAKLKTIIHYSTKDGLCNNRIREIKEDKWGNLFIATLAGISKFDGQRFTTLPVVESNDWKLQPDDLWFVSFKDTFGKNGPYRYDGQTLYHLIFPKHYREATYQPNAAFSPYDVYVNYKDRKGNIWLGTSNFGICRYDGKTLSWLYEQHLTEVPGGGWFCIRSIVEDKSGKFWFCNTGFRYNIDSGNYREEQGTTLMHYQSEKGIDSFKAPDGSDRIYFMSVTEDEQGDLWMATYNLGIWRYDGKNFTHYPVKEDGKEVTVFSIYKDRKGILWLGTHQAGAYRFNGKTFEPFGR